MLSRWYLSRGDSDGRGASAYLEIFVLTAAPTMAVGGCIYLYPIQPLLENAKFQGNLK